MEDIIHSKPHFLIVTFPAQGHINPALHFAKRLIRAGANVTFATSVSGLKYINITHEPETLKFTAFTEGSEDVFRPNDGNMMDYMTKFRETGSQSLAGILEGSREGQGKQVTCLVYTPLLPWAARVAREYHVPSASLWIQPAAVFDVYYYTFTKYKDVLQERENDPLWSMKLPNISFTLKTRDLPSFLLSSNPHPYTFAPPLFREQIEELEREETPTVLVNTYDALEVEALKAIERFTLIPVGPLLPPDFFDLSLAHRYEDEGYMDWLDSQDKSSVIYVSFGTISVLSGPQQDTLARALIQTRRPFLWVIREKEGDGDDDDNDLKCMEEVKQLGMIVPWCIQVKVLSHPSVGCFLTHCGWNSTLESLTCGVPMVGFPQWSDQFTNAKLVEDVWKTGVRVNESEGGKGLVKEEEIKRCLQVVMGSEKIKENAKNWKELAIRAAKDGGGSDMNLKSFVDKIASLQRGSYAL